MGRSKAKSATLRQSAPAPSQGMTRIVYALVLVAMAFVAYLPVWRGSFLWDDNVLLTGNALVHADSGFRDIWLGRQSLDYFPLTYSSFWIEWHLWGLNPLGYHLVNIFLLGIGAVLLWRVGEALKISRPWIIAAVFVLHPVNVVSVAWIAERKNTLSLPFYLAAVLFYLAFDSGGARRFYALSLVMFLLALLSKASVIMLPVVLLLCVWWRRGIVTVADLRRLAPFFLISLIFGLMTIRLQHAGGPEGTEHLESLGWGVRFALIGCSVWFYLWKALVPWDLMMVYPRWHVDAGFWIWYAPTVLLAGVLALCWWRKSAWGRAPFFGLAYFTVSLFPVSGIFAMSWMRYSFVAGHMEYVALPGIIALVVACACRIAAGRAAAILLTVMLAAAGVLTWRESATYSSSEALWTVNLARNPGSWIAHKNLGDALCQTGQETLAISQLQKSLAMHPGDAGADNNLGNALVENSRTDEAIAHFREALAINPGDPITLNNLGDALMREGKLADASDCFEQILRANPKNAIAENNLGGVLLRQGRFSEAVSRIRKSLEIDPNNASAHNNLANALLQENQPAEAAEHFQKSLELDPGDAIVEGNFGNILFQLGKTDEAIPHFEKALELNPGDATTHSNLGIALLQTGSTDDAISHFQKAMQIAPGDAQTHCSLGNALLKKGQVREALAQYRNAVDIQPGNISALNNISWLLLNTNDPSLRNNPEAIQAAREANRISGGQDPVILHTLATAFAADRQYDQAIDLSQQALGIARARSNQDMIDSLQAEIRDYQSATASPADGGK